MAKPAKQLSDSDNLVLLQLTYWGKFVVPVDVAMQVMTILIKCGAMSVENGTTGKTNYYYPKKTDLSVHTLDQLYLSDCPLDGTAQKGYFDWLKTKSELCGKDYELETYAEYLKQKAGE